MSPAAKAAARVRTVAYLSAGYPRVTDAFITREIRGVSDTGLRVERFAVRPPSDDRIAGPDQRAEREATSYLLERPRSDVVAAAIRAVRRSPRRALSAARLAAATRRPGVDGTWHQVAYLVEAAVLADALIEREVDHLHNHFADSSCTVAMLASELTGIPFSFTVHGPAIFFEPRDWALETKQARASFVVTISSFARSQASIYCDPDRWDRLHIVHCGVDDVGPAVAPPGDGPVRLVFVGRLEPVKGVLVLLDAIARVVAEGTAVELTVAGDGAMRGALEERSTELGIDGNVRFVGYRSQPEIAEHIAASHAVVLPSFAEGVPVSLMEAMSLERCVVATGVGGVTELVEDGVDGFVVTPGDVDALADAIRAVDGDRERCRRMGRAGRTKVREQFDSATEARRLVALFRDPERLRGVVRPEPVAPA